MAEMRCIPGRKGRTLDRRYCFDRIWRPAPSRLYSGAVANYQAIVRRKPEVRDFIRNRRWVYRGEAVVYGPNTRCAAFSTDGQGFRHSTFQGETLSVNDCLKRERYGLVLGSSHLYGFGLDGNENTIPSLLAEQLRFPFGNVCMPEASSRNLYSLLAACVARAPHPPSIVIHMSGGDFTSFCFTKIADPMFGSPNLKQMQTVLKEHGGRANAVAQFPQLLAFTSLWTRSIAALCKARGAALALASDTTFFEKREPSAYDVECGLGAPSSPVQKEQFAVHKRYFPQFCANRSRLAQALGLGLVGPGTSNNLGFVDEFHYDRDASKVLATELGKAVTQLLN